MGPAIDFVYRYRFATGWDQPEGKPRLRLATFGGKEPNPYFFEGLIAQPAMVSDMLLTLCQVVRTHFFQPRPAQLDPVVTCSDGMLRFEGFSGCCGVYARVDLTSETFQSDITGRGTTNVDFNDPMRAGLTRLRQAKGARLAVGADSVALAVSDEAFVEKKVKLPVRWIKGFSEVQAYQPTLSQRLEIRGPDILRFLRSLPRGTAGNRPAWVVPAGRGLRLSQREQRAGIRITGTHRLGVLEPLAAGARSLRGWADDRSGVSAWEMCFETGRFLLLLSPELYRGFSGEGQLLETLASKEWQTALSAVRAALTWNAHVEVAEVAGTCHLTEERVTAALAALGARGLVGFDLFEGKYFHRELPFDLGQVEALQPRLKNARKLVRERKLREHKRIDDQQIEILVQGTGVEHLVRLGPEGDRCTCPWFSKYQGERGPCKHLIAARLFVEGDEDDA